MFEEDENEQERIDREAREAERDAESRAVDMLAQAPSPLEAMGQAPPRRTVDLGMEDDPSTRFEVPGDVAQLPPEQNTDDYTDPSTGTAAPIHPMEGEDHTDPVLAPPEPASSTTAAPPSDPEQLALAQFTGASAAPSAPAADELALGRIQQAPAPPRPRSAFEQWSRAPMPQPPQPAPPVGSEFTYERGSLERAGDLAAPTRKTPAAEPPPGAPRLDDGLPTEAEIADARDNPLEAIIHLLQNGLRGAIGRPRRDYEARADQLAEQRRTGLERRMGAKQTARREDAAAARQSSLDERAQAQLAQGERRLDLQERQADTQAELARSLVEQRSAQTSHLTTADEIARASRADREDPTSPISMGAQQAVRTSLRALRPQLRAELEQSFTQPIESMSAAQLEATVRRLQTIGIRAGGGGTGTATPTGEGGGGTLAEQYVLHGISPSVEAAQATIDSLGGAGDVRARQVLASRLNEETTAAPGPQTQSAIAATQTSLQALQSRLRGYHGGDIPGIGLVDGNVPYLALSPEGREMRQLVRDLSDNYLRMVSGAAIPEHEIEQFAQRLAATDEAQFPAAVARLERELAARQRGGAAVAPRPARPPQGPAARERPAPSSSSTEPTVRIRRARDGAVREVPASMVAGGLPAGFEEVR